MTVRVESVESPADSWWWKLVADDPESLGEHCHEWVQAATSGRWRDASRGYLLSDGRRFVLPLLDLGGGTGSLRRLAGFPTGWGMGGLVGVDVDADAIAAVLADLATLDALRVAVRAEPRQARLWGVAVDAMVAAGTLDDRRVARVPRTGHVADLPGDPDDVLAMFSSNGRRNVRKAERAGVEIRLDRGGELIDDYLGLRDASIHRWADASRIPTSVLRARDRRIDPPDKLAGWRRALGERCQLRVAYVDGQAAAATVVLVGRAAHYTRGVMNVDVAGPSRATHLLHHAAMCSAIELGCRTYHLGETGESRDLARFKESLGAVAVGHDEVRLERIPLTAIDRQARALVWRAVGVVRRG